MPRRPGVLVRPEAVRTARSEAGLTLKQLAGSDLTKQAISLVEQGRCRPSLRTLRLIAERTGRPLDYFIAGPLPVESVPLDVEVQLAELEETSSRELYSEVIELGIRLLSLDLPLSARARVQLRLGKAYVKLFQPAPALEHLGTARAAFQHVGDGWLEVECMNYQAGAMHLMEDLGAVEVAEEALRRCRELDPVPLQTELSLLVNLATFHARRHAWNEAIAAGQEALARADNVQDLGRMARLNFSLAVAYRNQGDVARALSYAQKALALQEFERDGAQKARVENTMGLLLLQQGDYEGAERSLRRSLDSYARTPQAVAGREHALMSLAELHLARKQPVDAEHVLREAIGGFAGRGERMSVALGHQLLGSSLEAQGRPAEADRAFRRAISLLEKLAVPDRLAECHAAYASVLEGRGDTERALKHWRRGLLSQRPDLEPARKSAVRAAGA